MNDQPLSLALGAGGFQTRSPIPLKDLLCWWAWVTLNLTSWLKRPLDGLMRKLGKRVTALSDHCSKLRGPSQNSFTVGSKWNVKIKLN
ncbi:hypothetical protein AVEN_118599-1 [Araneus ventricosus]|uniref:Uncharacterized protein n=1 Tax=Araneus ventricosus TaxID=182803 RepID=A0A4Y2AWT7_ARAVE|nr:hypothetical protein AVEN_118599-1 [Araneus ventricosus]